MGVVKIVLLTQLLIVIIAPLVVYPVFGKTAAISALCGAGIGLLPNAYMAARLFLRPQLRNDSTAFLKAAFAAEFGKFVMTAVLFAVVFIWLEPLNVPMLFAGFILALAAWWVALLSGRNRAGRHESNDQSGQVS